MQLVSRPPREPQLRGIVRSLWHCRDPGARGLEQLLPSGLMQLLINVGGDRLRHATSVGGPVTRCSAAVVQGLQSRPIVLDRRDQRELFGVVFEPGAARAVLGISLDAVADTHVDLCDLTPGGPPLRPHMLRGATLDQRFARIERWLLARRRRPIDRMVMRAVVLMQRGEQRVCALAADIGTSERRLRRRFRAEVGLPPKQFARVLRMQRALVGLRGGEPLAVVAQSSGYHDQAHLSHELRELASVSPGDYRQRRPRYPNHLRLPGD